MPQVNKQELLQALKGEGVNSLEELATYLEKKLQQKDAQGNSLVASAIISNHYFVSH